MSERSPTNDADSTDGLFPLPVGERRLKYLFYGGLLVYVLYHLSVATDWSWENKLFSYLVGIPLVALIVLNLVLIKFPWIRQRFVSDADSEGLMSKVLSTDTDETTSRGSDSERNSESSPGRSHSPSRSMSSGSSTRCRRSYSCSRCTTCGTSRCHSWRRNCSRSSPTSCC